MIKGRSTFDAVAVVFAGLLCGQPVWAAPQSATDLTLSQDAGNRPHVLPQQPNHTHKLPRRSLHEAPSVPVTDPARHSAPLPVAKRSTPTPVHDAAVMSHDEAVESVDTVDVSPVSVDGSTAQNDVNTWYGDAWPMFDRVIDAYTARTSRKGTFNTLISHRNNGGFGRAPFDSLLGFDQGLLKVGLGVRYGIIDLLDVGILRTNGTYEIFDTYEFDLRYQLLKQEKFGIDAALRVGFSWFAQPGAQKDAAAPFVSLLLNRLVVNRAIVGFSLLYHQSSSGPFKNAQDSGPSVALQLYTDVRLTEGLSVALEFTQPIAGYHEVNPNLTLGPRFITNRHTFAIVLTNTQYTSADGIVTGNSRTNFRDWMLGFNITRELG